MEALKNCLGVYTRLWLPPNEGRKNKSPVVCLAADVYFSFRIQNTLKPNSRTPSADSLNCHFPRKVAATLPLKQPLRFLAS